MQKAYQSFRRQVNAERLVKNTASLLKLEQGQTFPCYHASAEKAFQLLQEAGIPNAEKIAFPADGKTQYQDKITPMGWDISNAKITLISGPGIKEGTVLADYRRHPFHVIKGSTALEPGGEYLRILTLEQVAAGDDPHDALVLLKEGTYLCFEAIPSMLDQGAKGFICDFSMNSDTEPDGLQWWNAFTEHKSWHTQAYDRPFVAFCISPEDGRKLRIAVNQGDVLAKVESDGRRYESTLDVVTAMLPGRRRQEMWILAHLYEPLANDNSSGVAAAIETARMIMAQGTPEFSLRVIFGLKHYGFAQYAVLRGDKNLSGEVIGAINYDAMFLRNDWQINFNCASPALPFYGNLLIKPLAQALSDLDNVPRITPRNSFASMYDDDTFLGDSTTGVPTVWPIRTGKCLWHNSRQTMPYIEPEAFATGCAINATFVDAVINPRETVLEAIPEMARQELKDELKRCVGSAKEHLQRRYEIISQDLMNFTRIFPPEKIAPILRKVTHAYAWLAAGLPDDIPHSPWRDLAQRITPSRLTVGLPFDLAKVPPEKRKPLPGSVIYSPLAAVLANMDGKRSLAQILRMVEHETCRELQEGDVKELVLAVFYLAQNGYLSTGNFKGLSKQDIIAALKEAGIEPGDFLILHSSLNAFGRIEGGPTTVVEALKELLGPEGTFLCPVLRSVFTYIGGVCKSSWGKRPFQEDNYTQIWTGGLPRYLMSHGATRSHHYTHAFCGCGKLAEEACKYQNWNDPPMGNSSPLAYALQHNAKILHFGNTLASTTFLHFLENEYDLPGVEDSVVQVKLPNGYAKMALVPRNLPGHRDFYIDNAENSKFFKKALAQGLDIRKAKLGIGTIQVMDMRQLHEIGSEIVKKDPYILLCDSDTCLSCRRLKAFNKQK